MEQVVGAEIGTQLLFRKILHSRGKFGSVVKFHTSLRIHRVLIPPKGTSGFPYKPGFHQTKIPPPCGGFYLNQASRTDKPIDPNTVKLPVCQLLTANQL